jgi:hypothetical protein
MRRSRSLLVLPVVLVIGATLTGSPAAADSHRGFRTALPSMLTTGDRSDVRFQPIITTGDVLANGYRYEAIPDGISVRRRGKSAELFINHETSTVPFPYVPAGPTAANSENDFDNAQLSVLNVTRDGRVRSGELAISSAENYQRFCSNYLATSREGFDRDILFTNEEAVEWVNRTGSAWPSEQGAPRARQVGLTVAYDVATGRRAPIWGMGRLNHENTVAIPGYDDLVTLTGDDTFASNPAQSQVYSYIVDDTRDLLRDKGDLWAFVSDTPGFDDYYDFTPGSTQEISGHFIKVDRDVATGRKSDGTDLTAADKGYPPPPATGWATDANLKPVDGPQWVLEHWGDLHGVFQFVRVEDIAYDKRPGLGNVVYIADTGRGSTGQGAGVSTNGRIWRMVLDREDPRKVTSLSIMVEGDDMPVKTLGEIHQPDNVETTRNSLLITEDPGSSQQFPAGSTDPAATTGRLWRVPLDGGASKVVAKIDQSADGGATDVDGRAPGNWGAWETTGVVDASSVFGRGAFLVNVQAHTLWVEQGPGADNNGDGQPDFTNKREGGQLVLVRIPGA